MSNQNHSFIGNLVRDPESRTVSTANGDTTVASFSVAVNGRKPEDTVYFECEIWGKQAEVVVEHFKKGKPIIVNDSEARIETWNDKTTNEKRSKLKFRVNRFGFVPSAKAEESNSEPAPKTTPKSASPKRLPPPPVEDNTDEYLDNIPF